MPCVRLVLPCLVLLAAAAWTPAGEDPAPAIQIRTVNLEVLFKECVLVQRNSDKLTAEKRKAKGEIDAREAQVTELKNNFKIIPQDRPIWAEMKEKVEVEAVRFKLFAERRVKGLQKMEAELIKQSYLELKKLLGEFAEEKGIALILLQPGNEMGGSQVQEVRLEISMRPVVHSDPSLDITKDFIAFANARVPAPSKEAPAMDPAKAPAKGPAKGGGFEKTPVPKVP